MGEKRESAVKGGANIFLGWVGHTLIKVAAGIAFADVALHLGTVRTFTWYLLWSKIRHNHDNVPQ